MKKCSLLPTFLLFFFLCSCTGPEEKKQKEPDGETIVRKNGEYLLVPPPTPLPAPQYPWREQHVGVYSKITKEFFRCKGTSLNPERIIEKNGKPERISDCGGSERHSLPLRNNKEFIYPTLLNLLNHIQSKTGKRVIITSGHRCPEHNTYVDPSISNNYSKHMLGAEVSFFVQGMEDKPELIIDLILDYYKNTASYKDKSDFNTFQRYEKGDTNVTTKPWFNKEVFIKLFKPDEGRNLDNRHPFAYIAIQIRFDTERNANVTYSWEEAHKNYLRK